MRVSRSGGCTSVMRPHSKRVRSRSSRVASLRGGRSEEMTICLLLLCSTLKVWKNSSWMPSRPSRNWMSSTRSMSTSRYRLLKAMVRSSRSELMKSLVNSSVETYLTFIPGNRRWA